MSDLLLERATELAAIDRAIRMARAGSGRQVVIAGSPGTGRSAVLERAQTRAAAHGLNVLSARGEEQERAFEFALAHRLLEPAAIGGEMERYAALLELNRMLAAEAPAFVAVDDLHACDAASLDWIVFLARRLRRSGIALVAAADSAATALLATLEDCGARVLHLRPLSEGAVAAVLRVELGHAVPADFVAACHRATCGIPLLLRELAGAMRRSGIEPQRAALERVMSPGIARFVARRLEPLPPTARTLARAVALLGDGAALRDAAELARLEPEAAAVAADRLREAGLLAGGDALAVAPPLVTRALQDEIPPARRALMHARAARLAARAGERATVVAEHLLRSEPADDPWVRATLRRAADQLLERGEPQAAVQLLRRAAAEAVGDDHADLFVALANAERRAGDAVEIEHLEAALDIAPDPQIATALALALLTHGRPAEAFAVADVNPAQLHAAADVCLGLPQALAVDAESEIATATRTLESGCDPESPAYFLACATLVRADRLALARSHLERALEHARRVGSLPGLVHAESWQAVAALHAGDLDACVVHATRALGAGRRTALGVHARAALALALLELDRAEEAGAFSAAGAAELRYARGRLRLARRDTEGALADFLSVGGDVRIPWRSAAARALAALGSAGEAYELAQEEHALAVRYGARRSIGVALRALAAVGSASERTERCRAAVEVLARSESRLEYAHALCDLGAALRHERAGREARGPLRQALDIAVRCGARALARRAREELAASGARPRRMAQSGRDALTPAELRVATLAARGLANREIAETLVVTVKTVETQLGHAYAKLGIRSRRELATALDQS